LISPPRAARAKAVKVPASAISRACLLYTSISLPVVLAAEQAYQQADISLVQARAGRYADTVALFAAVGGGWWRRDDLRG